MGARFGFRISSFVFVLIAATDIFLRIEVHSCLSLRSRDGASFLQVGLRWQVLPKTSPGALYFPCRRGAAGVFLAPLSLLVALLVLHFPIIVYIAGACNEPVV